MNTLLKLRTMMSLSGVLLLAIAATLLPNRGEAQKLTGAVLCSGNENGNYDGWDYFTTGNGPSSRFYFQLDGKWLNDGDDPLDFALTPGFHTLKFYAQAVNSEDRFGLNLFFDGELEKPAISVFVKAARATKEKTAFAPVSGNTMRLDTKEAKAANTAKAKVGNLTVEVTEFQILHPSVEKTDLVNLKGHNPNGTPDLVGKLTLTVSAAPVPDAAPAPATNPPTGKSTSPRFEYKLLDTEIGDVTPVAINNPGQVLFSQLVDGGFRCSVWQNGQRTVLPSQGFAWVKGVAINARGDVAGYLARPPKYEPEKAFLWAGGKMTDLGVTGRPTVCAMDDAGRILGSTEDAKGAKKGFMWEAGRVTQLPFEPVGFSSTGAIIGIETNGEAVRYFLWENGKRTPMPAELGKLLKFRGNTKGDYAGLTEKLGGRFPNTRPALFADGKLTDLGLLPDTPDGNSNAVNAAKQVVGRCYRIDMDKDFVPRSFGFLWMGGKMYDLNKLTNLPTGWRLTDALDINDRGEIVATAHETGKQHVILLTPK